MTTGEAGVPVMVMRGGSSKGAYFRSEDLPGDAADRNDLLLRIMGSPDGRLIDGIGGAYPLTSKVKQLDSVAETQTKPAAHSSSFLHMPHWPTGSLRRRAGVVCTEVRRS